MDTSVKADESRNSSMPRDGDNKLKLFEKIVYFASGSIGDEALMVLKNSNAESTRLLSDSVTHCIVGKNYVEADVSAARELYDVTTVTPEWIRMSVLCNKLLPTKPFNPFEDNLFSGIVVCVSQQIANDCKILWALVTNNGGTFQLTLNLKKTTHLVVTKPFGKKYDAVLSSGSDKIKIVTPDWIIDCLKNKELCPETNYHPRLLVMPKLLPTNQSFKLQTSGLSTITGFADFDAPVEQPGSVVPKNQGLEQLKQRLPWNQPPTPPTSQPVHTPSSQVAQSNTTQLKPMMSLMSTPQLQRLSQQQVQQLQLQQQTHANNQLLSQQQMHMPQQQNQFQQQIRTQQMQQSKQIQLQHGQQLQYQPNQQQMQQTHMQMQQGQQTHLQMMQKGQQQTLQQNQQHIQMQQKVQQLQSIPGQQLQNQQQQVVLQQQNVQIQSGQQQQQNVQQLQSSQQPNQIPLLQQQTVQIQQGQLPQLQPQSVQIQQGQPQQQQVQMPQLQQQTVQLQQGQQQQGQLAQLQKQTVQLQQNPQHSNQLQQGQQIQPQQIQFQTSNGQQVQFPQQVTQNAQVHLQQQQPQLQNAQSTQSSQICIVSNGQQLQQTQANPSNQQQQLLLQQQQRLMFQQRIVQQGGGTVSTQWRMAHPPSNMPRVQVNQQQSQQIQQQQTLVIGQQPTVNMNNANTQPTTQTQWPPQQTLTIQRTIQQPMDQRQVIWSQQSPHGPQQMIHMDAKTHQQIQAMNPAERLAFINKLTKQRNLVLQQFNARQQQAAGVAGGTNIVRPSTTPNGQTTVIRTLNHQLISSTGMTPAQQAQWNQIRQQQLLAQQQQQQQQQMAGGTVTTGLPTNTKTVSNTLVNNQQVVQPQTTIWQQSPVTEQGHQQTTGSMSAAQLAQIHQRQQQLQQLRLQQLQMDASQKQQTMQQQVAPNQAPIAGTMQPNVVQSPQVAAAQTSIVQPQQTPTLPTNEQTETQTPSQEPFPQMSGQEISAAGQLRLMTAQHHAAQQQGSTQGTYQSRTVLNNVTNSTATNRAPQVVGRAAVQPTVASKTVPANYNQSAAVRVAAVLAKSAAGQTVGHQQLPHQARFFGHNPNLKLPPDKCLLGCIFLIVEYDRCPDTIKDVPTWKQIILDYGGEIEPSYTLRLTHILCQTQKHPLVQQGLRDGKRCITAYWLSDIITKQQLMPPWYALHFPTPYSEERPCRQMLISLTNFESDERNRVKFMIELTGARVTSYFSADNNILVTRKLEGKKVKKARDINRPVVNVQWLNEILFGHLSCMYQPENVKYQQFNLNNPFRVDYNLVLHLMGAWKMPINVTQESYDRVRNNHVPVKRKRPRPNANFPDQENNDLSTADIIITNINPPPIEYRPCVMLSGFGLGKEEQRMVLQLGGTIAKIYSDATHLVMKESVRTTKFLCCVSTVKHIVSAEWLKDSSTQHMFLGEAIYTIEEVSVDQKVICKVHKILSNPNRHELFKGKIFYVTPGVTHPSVFIVRQIIESAGGTVEKQRRSLRAIQELEPNTYIVIASNNDLHLVSDLIRSSYGIYSSEFVLSAVMTQFVNYDMAYKKAKKTIN
ncbi:PAX-interacting protein 1 isoform X2 [Metopolophium dirhodum]|uniref:PAX-interacting protein 1 isoform X2 n=1 Tax=Metopolophium dirhodum TaxID=44670 RepID=UPI0029903C66|nr:PAX-interacting protein 1 isoform X2 [Metopolophium dirhodum]